MLFKDIPVSFTLRPKHLLVSPIAALVAVGVFYLPWGAESAPAWVQGVGSIGAIIAALVISNHQHAVAAARAAAEREENESGLSKRLAFFALELEQVVSNVILDQWTLGIAEADQRVAFVLESLLSRVNTGFDDDLNTERVALLFEFRVTISGLIFTLNGTDAIGPRDRDKNIGSYKKTVKGLLARSTEHAKGLNSRA